MADLDLVPHAELARTLAAGRRRLTHNGGPGDGRTALIGREVATVADALERSIATSAIRDAEARTGRPLAQMTLLELLRDVDARCGHQEALANRVRAEIGRLQNAAMGVR